MRLDPKTACGELVSLPQAVFDVSDVSMAERPFAARRRELALTVNQAAARLNVHPAYLRSLELCKRPLTPALAARMAGVYLTTISTLTRPADDSAGGTGGGCSGSRNPLHPRSGDDFIRVEELGATPEELSNSALLQLTGNDGAQVVDARDLDGFEPWERLEDVS